MGQSTGQIVKECMMIYNGKESNEELIDRMLDVEHYLEKGFSDDENYVDLIQTWCQKRCGWIPEYDFDEMKHHTLHLHAVTLALHVAIEKKYDEACYHFMVALTESVQLRKPLNVNEVLNYLQKYLGFITTTVLMSKDEMEEFREMDKIIRRSEQYRLFGSWYEEISGIFHDSSDGMFHGCDNSLWCNSQGFSG